MPASKRVLVVDDDEGIRGLLTSVLRRRDLVVDEAANGADALDLLRQNIYSVVLLDLLMPNIDGFGVLDELDSALAPPVVLVITGADRSLFKRLDPQRIHGVLRKPFDVDDLASLVVACVEIKSRRGFETMAISALVAGAPLFAWLNRFGG
jgi:CheY-like chemotaxis protein